MQLPLFQLQVIVVAVSAVAIGANVVDVAVVAVVDVVDVVVVFGIIDPIEMGSIWKSAKRKKRTCLWLFMGQKICLSAIPSEG